MLFLFIGWNRKWLRNISISLLSSENSQLSEEKEGKILLNLLSISTIGPLIFTHCLNSFSSNSWCGSLSFVYLVFRSNLMIWFIDRVCALMLWTKAQSVQAIEQLLYWVTQENSIEFQVQSSLPYILIPLVCANYCAPYPKWPWVIHEANMWCPCCMMSLCSSSFYFILLSTIISLVTTPSTCDWCDSVTDNP